VFGVQDMQIANRKLKIENALLPIYVRFWSDLFAWKMEETDYNLITRLRRDCRWITSVRLINTMWPQQIETRSQVRCVMSLAPRTVLRALAFNLSDSTGRNFLLDIARCGRGEER